MRSALPLLVNGLSCESSLTYMTASTQDCTLRCQHENWPPYICAQGKDHCPRTSQRRKQIKEWFFLAAMQGCRPCVQHCIDVIGLDVNIHSDNKKYTVMDWSQWAVDKDVEGAQEVVTYLTSECHMDIHPRTIDPLTILQINDVYVPVAVPQPPPPLPSTDDLPPDIASTIVPYYSVSHAAILTTLMPPLPFEGGKHLCKKHKPMAKRKQDVPKYWLFNAVKDGCKVCVGTCVARHGIDINALSDNNQYTVVDFARYKGDEEMLFFLELLDEHD